MIWGYFRKPPIKLVNISGRSLGFMVINYRPWIFMGFRNQLTTEPTELWRLGKQQQQQQQQSYGGCNRNMKGILPAIFWITTSTPED